MRPSIHIDKTSTFQGYDLCLVDVKCEIDNDKNCLFIHRNELVKETLIALLKELNITYKDERDSIFVRKTNNYYFVDEQSIPTIYIKSGENYSYGIFEN